MVCLHVCLALDYFYGGAAFVRPPASDDSLAAREKIGKVGKPLLP
jgi:hypothetical protein